MLKGLREFLFKGNVVDLAVAVIIGAAFGAVIASLVGDVLMPLLGWLFGKPDFSTLYIGPVAIGKFLNALVNFLLVGTAVYFLVVVPIQARLKRQAEAPPPPPSEEATLLREILAELRRRP